MSRPARSYSSLRHDLRRRPRRWLVTGAAGFIGSHLVEHLIALDQHVVGLDNFSTGHPGNLEQAVARATPAQRARFRFVEGDIRDSETCAEVMQGVDLVLHEAALGSVPRSIKDPLQSHEVNVTGFLRVLDAARNTDVKRIVYASSSSVYGDHPALPKVEPTVGHPLSPYAVTKFADELYARVFDGCYGVEAVGLRYFNVFGPRQDPDGPYAAVIPRWFAALRDGDRVVINGDGETSRDFCYVENVVQANLLAATTPDREARGEVFNVACGDRTTLNELYQLIRDCVLALDDRATPSEPEYAPFRAGDVRHSLAEIEKAQRVLGYAPTHAVRAGLETAAAWYLASPRAKARREIARSDEGPPATSPLG